MTQTILGILIGIVTSFIAGIFLVWKGEQLVHFFRRLPAKTRVAIYARRAYLIALRSYPYRYAHLLVMTNVVVFTLILLLAYGFMTYVAFGVDFSLPPEETKESFRLLLKPGSQLINIILNPWFLLSATLLLAYSVLRILFVTIPPELLVPYAHRELVRLRECVAKCGTKKQFIEYADAEYSTRTLEDLRELIIHAKTILGNFDLKLADAILEGIMTDLPKPIESTEFHLKVDRPDRS